METVNSNAQAHRNPVKEFVSWDEVKTRIMEVEKNIHGKLIYGIPRGGMIVAGFMYHKFLPITEPGDADFFIDDIIDSGRTRDKYANDFPGIPFHALFDKSPGGRDCERGWLVFPWELHEENADISDHITRVLEYIGEDPAREGLLETPSRVVKSWSKLYGGYREDPAEILGKTFESECDEMVILKNIELYSCCEHHMLPFIGKVHIGYLPGTGRVVGISKLARLVECFARRLQIQERLTKQIADAIQKELSPLGVGVIIEAQHLCMQMRGVEKQNSVMATSVMLGQFRENEAARAEFLSRIF